LFTAKVKNEWSCTVTSPVCLHGMYRDCFTFTYKRWNPLILQVCSLCEESWWAAQCRLPTLMSWLMSTDETSL
jgi:hypothetical protein